jgi:proteasome accessory factor C
MTRAHRGAEERLRRLLVMLPWLMERGEVPLAEVAERFRLTEHEVAADLELVAMCGLPPFVDELIDIFIDEGTVFVGVPRLFTRPLRLNSTEAFELLAAGRAAMELPGADPAGPLGRGLGKLAAALGGDAPVDSGLGAGLDVDLEPPEMTDEVADAARRLERLRIMYWSASRDESTERLITPR